MSSTPGERAADRERRVADRRSPVFERRYLDALRLGDARTARGVALEAIAAGIGPTEIQSRIIAPAMWAIGDLWAAGAISVADEHLATAISQTVAAELFSHLLASNATGGDRVVVAAVEGETHTLGVRMAADVLEGAGFEVRYLGADVPTDALLEACGRWQPGVVALGATMPLSVPTLLHAVDRLARLPDPPLVMAAGRACAAPAVQSAPVTVVDDTEGLLDALANAFAAPRGLSAGPDSEAVARPALPRLGAHGDPAPSLHAQLVETAEAAAELSRDHARRASSLEQIAFRDVLTGLWNRRALDDRLASMAEHAVPATLLMIDVDRFKQINDRHGHAAGDEALRGVAAAISGGLRAGDIAGRYGGDEFSVILPETDVDAGVRIAERIRDAVAASAATTVSVGVSELGGDLRLTMLRADRALYDAKAGGRNRVTRVAE